MPRHRQMASGRGDRAGLAVGRSRCAVPAHEGSSSQLGRLDGVLIRLVRGRITVLDAERLGDHAG
ncbi:hypothetical protein [Streptomyces sp. G-G2]|uniref:hypothetical protein n=1 Tax=Streptomyces sp. G-G2 TaxID=3046201 RepID=UPI0024B88940|nr:hypothetical protein [Streptomyces sp. G-G2]MDJ0382217.1 hypothetical protein [Streptomyces sp. G-G2]